jgi:hypothetical protein
MEVAPMADLDDHDHGTLAVHRRPPTRTKVELVNRHRDYPPDSADVTRSHVGVD